MGCVSSMLGSSYDDNPAAWQAPSKWQGPHNGMGGLAPAVSTVPDPYQERSPAARQEQPAYQPQPRSPMGVVATPQKAHIAFGRDAPEAVEGAHFVDPAELEDEFPAAGERVPQQQAPLNWSRGELIGAGAFGRVFLGLNNESGELMAVKQVTLSKDEGVAGKVAQHARELEKEVQVLRHLNHPNIVRYLGTDKSKDCSTLNIFLEYVPGGSIASLLSKFGSFKETVIKLYARQILAGLQYLHGNKIMHRDIKGANILVDNMGLVKLADFGASKKIEDLVTIDSGVKSIKGTSYWMAPEVIKQTGHGRMADIWSVGCTIIEMATGKPPWSQFSSQVSAMFHIASAKGPPPIPDHLSADAKDFLLLCLQRTPSQRPAAAALLQHPFLADVSNVKNAQATPLANLAVGPIRQANSPAVEEERPGRRTTGGEAATPTHPDAGSSEFRKLYSPMADRLAEAAARSRPASTTGERGGWPLDDALGNSPALEAQLRQSVASHASTRYDGVGADRRSGSPCGSSGDDSDYNPVEEPAWLQHDSLQATHFDYLPGSSPGDTPRIRAFGGGAESTAVASPLRGPQRRPGAGGAEDEIMSFVRDKAQKDIFRLSIPFGLPAAAKAGGPSPWQGSKQQQWEAELEEELNRQRTQLRAAVPA